MPPRKLTPTERQNRMLVGRIRMDQTISGDGLADTSRAIGVCPNTLRNRASKPGDFTFDELRQLVKRYHWDRDFLAQIFGAD